MQKLGIHQSTFVYTEKGIDRFTLILYTYMYSWAVGMHARVHNYVYVQEQCTATNGIISSACGHRLPMYNLIVT